MARSTQPAPRALLAFASAVFASMSALFIYFWEFYYNSDYAMISLIAKRFADFRDFPIFVYRAGYQGMLWDGIGTGVVFRLLGMSPFTMNVFEVFCTALLFVAFYFLVRKTDGSRTAAWAVLFLSFSCPNFYGRLMHPSPNYAQTFLLGVIWILLYLKILSRPRAWHVLAIGFVGGFGFYTYQMIAIFIGATAIHAGLVALQHAPIRKGGWREWIAPQRGLRNPLIRWAMNIVSGLSALTLLMSGVGYGGITAFQLGRLPVLWDPTQTLALTIILWALRHAANVIRWHRWMVWGGFGFAVGYLPKLIYTWIQHQPSIPRTSLGGSLHTLGVRVRFAAIEGFRFLNFTSLNVMQIALALATLGLMAWGIAKATRKGRSKDPRSLSPLLFLGPVVILTFITSAAVVDISNSRYMLSIWLFFAYALALGVSGLPRSPKVGASLALGLILFWGNTLLVYKKELDATERPHPHLAVRDWLESRGVSHGYADYWIAYSLNFLSHERLMFEPLYSNYIPDYGAQVSAQHRIAYVDNDPPRVPTDSKGRVNLGYRDYQVLEQAKIGDYRVQVVELVSPKENL